MSETRAVSAMEKNKERRGDKEHGGWGGDARLQF